MNIVSEGESKIDSYRERYEHIPYEITITVDICISSSKVIFNACHAVTRTYLIFLYNRLEE